MAPRYHHTQIGTLLLGVLGGGVCLLGLALAVVGFNRVVLAALVCLAACLGLFPTLTVTLDDRALRIRFGPGLIRKSFPLEGIEACRVVRNPWFYGWGIHRTPAGWLYNVSGLQAVELTLRSGKTLRIGTDEPETLAMAIRGSLTDLPG